MGFIVIETGRFWETFYHPLNQKVQNGSKSRILHKPKKKKKSQMLLSIFHFNKYLCKLENRLNDHKTKVKYKRQSKKKNHFQSIQVYITW